MSTLSDDIRDLGMYQLSNLEELSSNPIINRYFEITDDEKGAMEHIFTGYYGNDGGLIGYHSEALYRGKYGINNDSRITKIDKTKPYHIKMESKSPYNAFFPITMSIYEVIECILDALQVHIDKSVYFSQKYKMELQIFINKTNGKIFDAYPYRKPSERILA